MIGLPISILAQADPVAHVVDKEIYGQWIFSSVTLMLIVAALVSVWALGRAAVFITTGAGKTADDYRARGIWANLVETICVYLRSEVFQPVLGPDADRFTPILWTFFWFILICNLLGLIPLKDLTAMVGINHGHGVGGTATQSIWVTAALALVAFLLINVTAFVRSPVGYLKHMTAGAPWPMWFIMVPVELLGVFVKPFALCMRLFANMTGGHIVIAVMLGFVPALIHAIGPIGVGVAVLPILGATAIYFLEVLVAFIQAFVFTFLTTLFLGQMIVHDPEHGHNDADHHFSGGGVGGHQH